MLRRSVTPLLIGTFILRASGGAATVVLGLFLAQLSTYAGHLITSLQVGLLAVAFYVTELSLAPFMGALSDRWGRRYFLIFGPLVGLVDVLLIAFTPVHHPLPYLLSLQVLAGVSSALQVPVVLGYLADYTAQDASKRMRVMSFFELATSGGIAAGVILGGLLWDRFGHLTFALLASFYLLVVFCMILAPKTMQIIERGNLRAIGKRYWRIIRTPRLFIFIPAWICISSLAGIWLGSQLTFILSVPLHNKHQLLMGSMSGPGGGHRLSLVLGSYVLFFGLSLLFWAFFLGRVPRLRLMLTSVVGVYIACIALAGINHLGIGNSPLQLLWLPLLMVGIFAESSFAPAALAYLADISEEAAKDRGLLMGLYSIFLGLGQLLGNGLGGVFARLWGFDGLIYLTAILACVVLISLLALFQQEKVRLQA
ncbi:MAG TPA: MFS transporter [Ktedonobacteraceae bacterium]|nr:MFS transporter [Ktedonobacteraceae bacterium]